MTLITCPSDVSRRFCVTGGYARTASDKGKERVLEVTYEHTGQGSDMVMSVSQLVQTSGILTYKVMDMVTNAIWFQL